MHIIDIDILSLGIKETETPRLRLRLLTPAVLHYGFIEMGLNRIEAMTGPNNSASLQLIRWARFTEEGRLREHYYVNDRFEDSVVFGLLKSKYELNKGEVGKAKVR